MRNKILIGLMCLFMAVPATSPPVTAAEPAVMAYIAENTDADGGGEMADEGRLESSDTAYWASEDDVIPIEVEEDADEFKAVSLAMAIILYMCKVSGLALFIWGIVKFFQAMQCEHASARNTAVISIVTGAFLYCLRWFFLAAGILF